MIDFEQAYQSELLAEWERERAARDNCSDFLERGVPGVTGQRKAYWMSNARFPVVAAGRRSGKTLLSLWKLQERLWTPRPWNTRYFFAGPTQGQAKRIAWQVMLDLLQRGPHASRLHEPNLSDLILTVDLDTQRTASFHIIGLDSPQRMEGVGWDGGIGDERADWKAGLWAANMRPALADRNGFCFIIGTPDFEGNSSQEFREQFELGLLKQDGYESFTWPSSEVINAEEVEAARRDSPPNVFRQEYEASFESAPGRAYPDFVRTVHAKELFDYDPNVPLFVTCDFNREHHTWGLAQRWGEDGYSILEDIYIYNGTVDAMCSLVESRIATLQAKDVVFFGDYSGEQKRAEATDSAWLQIRTRFQGAMFRYKTQPAIADRIEKTNGVILNANGQRRLRVHPEKAKRHIRDFEEVTRAMLYSGSKGGELTHASDGFGYMVCQNTVMRNYFAMN